MFLCHFIIYCLWILFSFLEGFREAFYWDMKSRTTYRKDLNLHPFFSLQRGIFIFMIFLLLTIKVSVVHALLVCLFCSISFPFIHDGVYYTTRHYLDKKIYERKWFDQSNTSTAYMTKFFTPIVRTILFVIGTICIFII